MSFFLVEKLSIIVQKFSKCPKNGNDRLQKGNLFRRTSVGGILICVNWLFQITPARCFEVFLV